MPVPAEPVVSCAELTRRFAGVAAVDGVSLQIPRGEIFAVVGPDGAGKTTLLRLLCGALTPDRGAAMILGFDVVADPEAVKARIGYMPQRFSLYGDLSVMENLRLYADIYRVPPSAFRPRADSLLRDFRLLPFAGRPAQQLSGGMKQKLALACTLIHNPALLFLDEPTTGVDPVSRRQFWRILYDLNRSDITLVVSTPYMDEAERCSRVAFMDRGAIIACDTPAALRAQMEGEILEVIAVPKNVVKRRLRDHPLVKSLEVFGDRLHVLVLSGREAIPQLHTALESAGATVTTLRPIPPSLEDVFVARVTAGALTARSVSVDGGTRAAG